MWNWFFGKAQVKQESSPDSSIYKNVVRFGSLLMSTLEAKQHFLAIGSTGSGKTTLIRLFLQSVLSLFGYGNDVRLLYYDAKQDAYSMLKGISPGTTIYIFNPFDSRGCAWDIAQDITEPRHALEIPRFLFPDKKQMSEFFYLAACEFTVSAVISFMRRGLDWTLADLIRTIRDAELSRRVFEACPETRGMIDQYFGDKKLLGHIVATISAQLKSFEAIAFCWERADRRISLTEWIKSDTVLLLGNSEVSREAINACNRGLFRCLANLLLDQSESETRLTFIVIDEMSEAGKLDGITPLSKKGRTKGVSLFLATQSTAGLLDPDLYGKFQTTELLGQVGHFWIGRVGDVESSQFGSDLIGDQEIRQETVSRSSVSAHQDQG